MFTFCLIVWNIYDLIRSTEFSLNVSGCVFKNIRQASVTDGIHVLIQRADMFDYIHI